MKLTSCSFWLAAIIGSMTPVAATFATDDEQAVCTVEDFLNCLNGVASSVTNGAGLRMSSAEYGDVARERSGKKGEKSHAALYSPGSGVAAGDELGNSVFGMWTSYSYSEFDSDFVFQGSSLAYEADAHNVLAGFDRLLANRLLLGLALGYQWVEADTAFNGGGQESEGYTVAPYAALILSDVFSIDVSGGLSWVDYDQNRISPADGTNIQANFDADRWFVASNLNALVISDAWIFGAKVGYLHSDEKQDAYLESGSTASAAAGRLRTVTRRTIDLSQVVVGADIAYNMGVYEPYVMASYHNDLSRNDGTRAGGLPGNFTSVQPDDDDEIQLNFGIRYYTDWGVSATAEYQRVEGRSHFDSDTFMLTVRAAL
jgi:hypothetical protein